MAESEATPVPQGIVLENISFSGPSLIKKNLLFLGDGFSKEDEGLFNMSVKEIKNHIFKQSPFNLSKTRTKLETRFNIFKAFTPSTSSGISCISLKVDGFGFTQDDPESDHDTLHTLVEKRSALGLTYGYNSVARLIGPKPKDSALMKHFIETLKFPFELYGSAIPRCWAQSTDPNDKITGKDYGLIIVIVNDDKFGGGGLQEYATACLGKEDRFKGINILPDLEADHLPVTTNDTYYKRVALLALHELGHSHFNLEDEYSELYTPGIEEDESRFAGVPNVVTKKEISENGAISISKIKWYKKAFPGSTRDLISNDVIDYMERTGKALFEREPGTCATTGKDTSTKEPPEELRKKKKYSSRTIGLYEGGARESCGVYSPTGSCLMRKIDFDENIEDKTEEKVKRIDLNNDFCYVCQHAIIEKTDPSFLKTLYEKNYPRQ